MSIDSIVTASTIQSRALLVTLTVRTWTARKYSREITNRVNTSMNASDDAGRYNKHLLPGDAGSYQRLMTALTSLRADHYVRTLPWSDEGRRVLPTATYTAYSDWLRQSKARIDTLLADFVAEYPDLKRQAELRLNGMYQESDYPSVVDLPGRFEVTANFEPIPNGDIRVDLPDDQIATLNASVQSTVNRAVGVAMSDARERLVTVVRHMRDRLSDPEAIFRDSLVGNVRELCAMLPSLNLTHDSDLDAFVAETMSTLTVSPDILRDNKAVRQQTADKAADILARMSQVYGA